VGKDILKCIGELESVDVPKPELDVCIHDELSETKDFTA
jgi:hypothetical protein